MMSQMVDFRLVGMPSFLVETQFVFVISKDNPANKMQDFFHSIKEFQISFPKISILQILSFPQQKSRKKTQLVDDVMTQILPLFFKIKNAFNFEDHEK